MLLLLFIFGTLSCPSRVASMSPRTRRLQSSTRFRLLATENSRQYSSKCLKEFLRNLQPIFERYGIEISKNRINMDSIAATFDSMDVPEIPGLEYKHNGFTQLIGTLNGERVLIVQYNRRNYFFRKTIDNWTALAHNELFLTYINSFSDDTGYYGVFKLEYDQLSYFPLFAARSILSISTYQIMISTYLLAIKDLDVYKIGHGDINPMGFLVGIKENQLFFKLLLSPMITSELSIRKDLYQLGDSIYMLLYGKFVQDDKDGTLRDNFLSSLDSSLLPSYLVLDDFINICMTTNNINMLLEHPFLKYIE